MIENSLNRDTEWLLQHDRGDIDPENFSDWVTRLMADDMSEDDARLFVLNYQDSLST